MALSRRVVVLVTMLVLLALVIGVVGVVSASPDKDNNKKAHTLTVLTKTREARVVNLGPRGPSEGDMRVVNAPLYNASGAKKIGRLDLLAAYLGPSSLMPLFTRVRRETVRKASQASQPPHHQTAHRHVDERLARLGEPLVVLAHTSVLVYPGERPLHHPATR